MKWKMSIQQYAKEIGNVRTPWQKVSIRFRSLTLWLSIWLAMRQIEKTRRACHTRSLKS
jgi:hypothetical protein